MEVKVIISCNQFGDLVATFGYPGIGFVEFKFPKDILIDVFETKTEGKVIISCNQFSDLVAFLCYPGKESVLLFKSEEGF